MIILHGADQAVAGWVADQLDMERGFGPCSAIGVVDGEDVLGGVVFHNWMPEDGVIEMSAASASPRWLTRSVMDAAFGYVFDTLRCQLAVWRVAADDRRTSRLAERLGFTGYLIPRLRGRNDDETVYTLTDDAWRGSRFRRRKDG